MLQLNFLPLKLQDLGTESLNTGLVTLKINKNCLNYKT